MENKTLEQLKEKYADCIASLSDEDKAKVEACKTAEELMALAQNTEGALPDEIAEAVAGGKGSGSSETEPRKCPKCGKQMQLVSNRIDGRYWTCVQCKIDCSVFQ